MRIISLNSINTFNLIMDRHCVLYDVRTVLLYITELSVSPQGC